MRVTAASWQPDCIQGAESDMEPIKAVQTPPAGNIWNRCIASMLRRAAAPRKLVGNIAPDSRQLIAPEPMSGLEERAFAGFSQDTILTGLQRSVSVAFRHQSQTLCWQAVEASAALAKPFDKGATSRRDLDFAANRRAIRD
jgi:hypothetical protein